MGWERKRGKLLDLNKYLLQQYDSFPLKAGPMEALERVRYVITLDSDTQLPRGTAARMIGTMAHPLNQAIIDPNCASSPKDTASCNHASVSASLPHRVHVWHLSTPARPASTSTPAPSPMSTRISLAKASSPARASTRSSILHQVLDRRFPRNALLSHDLIEGSYARAGLVTDIEIIDDYPSHYSAHTRRKHRWVRGDWQIARWLFGRVPDESGKTGRKSHQHHLALEDTSIICAAAWSSRSLFFCSSSGGLFFRAEHSIGRSLASFSCFSQSLSNWLSTWVALC